MTGQSDYPRAPEVIQVHLFCDIIHVHPRWGAHVILGRALLHSWFKQKIETFARKQDPDFFRKFFS